MFDPDAISDAGRQLFVQDLFSDLKEFQCVLALDCLKIIADFAVEDRVVVCTAAARKSLGGTDTPMTGTHYPKLHETLEGLLWYCRVESGPKYTAHLPQLVLLVDVNVGSTELPLQTDDNAVLLDDAVDIGTIFHRAGCSWEDMLTPDVASCYTRPTLEIRTSCPDGDILIWRAPGKESILEDSKNNGCSQKVQHSLYIHNRDPSMLSPHIQLLPSRGCLCWGMYIVLETC